MPLNPAITIEQLHTRLERTLPGWFGCEVTELSEGRLVMEYDVRPEFLAPNGFLHAAAVIALADTGAGFATIAHLPAGASNFTTIELKANFLGTATEGRLRATVSAVHQGRTTQVWDSIVAHPASGRTLALFRCTQMVLWPK